MGIIKNKVKTHLKATEIKKDMQTGATTNRRVTENIYIIQYFIKKMKKTAIHLVNRLYQSL